LTVSPPEKNTDTDTDTNSKIEVKR
jgi:hypothetical protein